MYSYPQYKEHDRETVLAFMREYPFAMLVAVTNDGRPEISQLPVFVDERDGKIFLSGHIARKLEHQLAMEENPDVLVVFTGPHSYISGSWYSGSPGTASTWNYISVHARGRSRWMDDQELVQFMKRLTLHYENNDSNSPTVYDNLSTEYIEKLIKGIVAFEIEVTELENVFKLSQNRDEESYDNIIKELKQREGDEKLIGELMEKRREKVFKS